jgi:hypothetical protein
MLFTGAPCGAQYARRPHFGLSRGRHATPRKRGAFNQQVRAHRNTVESRAVSGSQADAVNYDGRASVARPLARAWWVGVMPAGNLGSLHCVALCRITRDDETPWLSSS